MTLRKLAMASVPVVLGVLIAGGVLYAFRDNDLVNNIRKGFDAGIL